jgi:hydroxybutyrate-dimer hydrolase
VPAFAADYIPLHVYFNEGLDRLHAHLTEGTALPPSQVVHTVPRGSAETPLTRDNVPVIENRPGKDSRITFTGSLLKIPE